MPYRLEDLNRLDEAAFRVNILIPLLNAVGYRDVEHYHGPNELGKDIVGWRESEDGSREYCAIVAKIGKINASATGDAATVTTQILQAFGSTFTNKVTGADAQAHRVIVAATGKIGERSRAAIRTQLHMHARHVRFWDGDTIIELLNEHLPERGVVADLERIRPKLTNFNSFEIRTILTSDGTVFRVAGKEHGAEFAQARIRFPESTDGKHAAKSFKKFVDEGGSIAIPGEYIEAFELHEELRSLFGIDSPAWIRMEQNGFGKPVPIRLEADGGEVTVESLVLRGWRGGRTQKVFRTEPTDAIEAELTLRKDGSITLQLHFTLNRQPVYRVRQILPLWQALGSGKSMAIRHGVTNEHLFRIERFSGIACPPSELVEVVDVLFEVQEAFGTSFMLPEAMTREIADDAFELRSIIRDGKVRRSFDTVSAQFSSDQVRIILEKYTRAPTQHFTLRMDDVEYELLGQTFPLGTIVRYLGDLTLPDQERDKLSMSLAEGNEQHNVTLNRAPDNAGEITYVPRYLKGVDLTEYERRFVR